MKKLSILLTAAALHVAGALDAGACVHCRCCLPAPRAPTARLQAPAAAVQAASPTPATFQRVAFDEHMDMLVSSGANENRDMLGVISVLPDDLRRRILDQVASPSFAWTTDRHSLYPTTDIEVNSVPWLEAEMAVLLKGSLLPAIARLFDVDEAELFLRDQFVVKYSCAAGCQAGLETHYDESCFSYVIQLNDPASFEGGGTLFEHAEAAVSVPAGDALLFCGYNRHGGVPVLGGERYVLTGFVDLRSDVASVRRFYGDLPGELPRPYGAGSNDFPSPHLATNSERLSHAYGGARGDALLEAIAYSPPALGAHVDLTRLRERCAMWLERGHIPNERFYAFLQAAVGSDSADDPGADEQRVVDGAAAAGEACVAHEVEDALCR